MYLVEKDIVVEGVLEMEDEGVSIIYDGSIVLYCSNLFS